MLRKDFNLALACDIFWIATFICIKKSHKKNYNAFRSRATGTLSCSRYFATVRRAML